MAVTIQIIINILISASIYALIASGFSLMYGVTRVLHLAHGAVILASSYIFFWLVQSVHAPVALAMGGAVLFAMLLGVAMEILIYYPMRARRASGLSLLIATLALLTFVTNAILIFFGSTTKQMNWPTDMTIWTIQGAVLTSWQLTIILVALFLLSLYTIFLKKTKIGVALRAVQDNVTVSEIVGIDTKKMFRIAFLLGSFLAGVVAVLWAVEYNLQPAVGTTFAIKAFIAAILGGVGSFGGAVVGGILLSVVDNLTVWFLPAGWSQGILFLILFCFLLFRPQGFFGIKKT